LKKLINKPENVVQEALEGVALAHPDLIKIHYAPNFVVRIDAPIKGKVGVISGGGSGHEPMHGGFVGMGMLDAACPGAVFTSPTPDQMLEATKAVDGGVGVLHIVKNYTGDIMNFEMAADLARTEGIEVAAVVTDDDVAVKDSLYTAGRRGVGSTVLAEKLCGAAAEQRRSLAQVVDVCMLVSLPLTSPKIRWRSASAFTANQVVCACHLRAQTKSSKCSWNPSSATSLTNPEMKY
jgi:dihydroxyacetone kinase-like protein